MTGQPRKSFAEVQTIVDEIRFQDRRIRLLEKGDGYLLQIQYDEMDVDHPEHGLVLQSARKWYISAYSTETEIVETAFKACKTSMEHVVKEHFMYKGRRVYSPHFPIAARIKVCDQWGFDARLTTKKTSA